MERGCGKRVAQGALKVGDKLGTAQLGEKGRQEPGEQCLVGREEATLRIEKEDLSRLRSEWGV